MKPWKCYFKHDWVVDGDILPVIRICRRCFACQFYHVVYISPELDIVDTQPGYYAFRWEEWP